MPDNWLQIEWTALANDLDNQADRLEQFVDSLRQRATYARQKAEEASPPLAAHGGWDA